MHLINAYNARMNLEHIKIFVLTYQTGHFASVAKELNVAPSSISRTIAGLEEQLKTRLFQRSTRKLIPTQAGELYYQKIKPVVEEFEHVNQQLIDDTSNPSGKIKITASTSYGQIILAPLLKTFCQQYPAITVDLLLSDTRVDIIAEQVDIAIRHGQLPDSSLIARKLKEVKYHLVATPDYLANNSTIAIPKDITQHSLITFNYEGFIKEWSFKKNQTLKKIPIEPKISISNAATIRDCVKNQLGLALLADWTIEKDLKTGALTSVLADWNISGSSQQSSIWLIQPSRAFIPAKVKAFTDFLLQHI